jgi:hypothetical protein
MGRLTLELPTALKNYICSITMLDPTDGEIVALVISLSYRFEWFKRLQNE